MKKGYHKTKDGRTVKKGLYYYMNRAKKRGTSKPGKGTVTDKALRRSAKTAVTGKVKPGSKAANRRKSYCARSAGQLRRSSAKTRNDPNSRIRQARRRWKC
jgi:hypothetical protein